MATPRALLIADDDPLERPWLSLMLQEAYPDAEICLAESAPEARALHEARAFDCVLLDYRMGDFDGLALTESLRAGAPYLPIILMTRLGDEMLAAEAMRRGASDYIPKDRMTVESLGRAVGRAIRDREQARMIDEQRRELETFAYALAHDFKQPIRQISTFTDLISEGIAAGEIESIQQHLTFLRDAARRLGALVDVMAQHTLLNRPPSLTDFCLAAALAAVEASLQPLLAERGAKLLLPRTRARVRACEPLMVQALQNLVVNGLTYNRSAVPRVRVTVREDGDLCQIAVADNGIGIEAGYLGEVFKPLVRLHTTAEFAGTGLGLTLARRAAVAQKGALWCESTPGVGSVFHLSIPSAAPRRRPAAAGPCAPHV